MKRLGIECRVHRHGERPEEIAALSADIEPHPPQQPAQWSRHPGDTFPALKLLEALQRGSRRPFDQLSDRAQRLAGRILYGDRTKRWLALVVALDHDHRSTGRVFVEMRPRDFHIRSPQFRKLLRDESKGLDEYGRPPRATLASGARCDQLAKGHVFLYRHRRNGPGKIKEIDHHPARNRKLDSPAAHQQRVMKLEPPESADLCASCSAGTRHQSAPPSFALPAGL